MTLSMLELTPNAFSIARWNKLHFASAQTFVYMKMFAVHDRAHKKSCTHVVIVHWSKNISKNAPLPGCIQNTDKNQPSIFYVIS